MFAAQGWSNDRIAAALSIGRDVVSQWRKRFFFMNVYRAWRNVNGPDGPGLFPPEVVVSIKAIACEPSADRELPLSRLSSTDIALAAQRSGLVASISGTTVWRWLNEDAIRPWQHRCWIFPRDPQFAMKAGRILDLYARQWEGKRLRPNEFVISADEKTSVQVRLRNHPSTLTRPGQPARIEHEYARGGAWALPCSPRCASRQALRSL